MAHLLGVRQTLTGHRFCQRAPNGESTTLDHMRVDLRGAYVRMAKLFLYGADIHATLEQVRGKGVAQSSEPLPTVYPTPHGKETRWH